VAPRRGNTEASQKVTLELTFVHEASSIWLKGWEALRANSLKVTRGNSSWRERIWGPNFAPRENVSHFHEYEGEVIVTSRSYCFNCQGEGVERCQQHVIDSGEKADRGTQASAPEQSPRVKASLQHANSPHLRYLFLWRIPLSRPLPHFVHATAQGPSRVHVATQGHRGPGSRLHFPHPAVLRAFSSCEF